MSQQAKQLPVFLHWGPALGSLASAPYPKVSPVLSESRTLCQALGAQIAASTPSERQSLAPMSSATHMFRECSQPLFGAAPATFGALAPCPQPCALLCPQACLGGNRSMSQPASASPAPAQLVGGSGHPAAAAASFGDLGSADAPAAVAAAAAARAQVVERHAKLPEGTDGPPLSLEVFSELGRCALMGCCFAFPAAMLQSA